VKVSDFGLARLTETQSPEHDRVGTIIVKDNTVMGTPDFLAPEQARSLHQTDIRSDLYGLGCTFYYLLTGRVPFPGGSTLEKLIRHSTEPPTPLRELRPDVPPGVVAVVERLMAKNPADRYQTPEDLIEALQPWAAGKPGQWSGLRRAVRPPPALDGDSTPTPTASDEFKFDLPGYGDGTGANVATLPPDHSPTPLSGGSVSSTGLSAALQERQKHRQKVALFWTLGIAGAALTAGGVLALVLSRM
jgi:serine/threonine protein kinase